VFLTILENRGTATLSTRTKAASSLRKEDVSVRGTSARVTAACEELVGDFTGTAPGGAAPPKNLLTRGEDAGAGGADGTASTVDDSGAVFTVSKTALGCRWTTSDGVEP
jgi:hypothetical protein